MIKILQDFLFKLDFFFNTKKLKVETIYENKKHNIYIVLSEKNKTIQIFNNGLIFKFPLEFDIKTDRDIESILNNISDLNIELNSKEDLEEMLAYYEEIEDYEKCKQIKDILKTKVK